MYLHLECTSSAEEVRHTLETHFPGIRIEFCFNGTERLNPSYRLHASFPHVPLWVLSPSCPASGIDIADHMTIDELEKLLSEQLQLSVTVYMFQDGYRVRNQKTGNMQLRARKRAVTRKNAARVVSHPAFS